MPSARFGSAPSFAALSLGLVCGLLFVGCGDDDDASKAAPAAGGAAGSSPNGAGSSGAAGASAGAAGTSAGSAGSSAGGGSTGGGAGGASNGGSGGNAGATAISSKPPAAPAPAAPDGTGTTVFAIQKLWLGDSDRQKAVSKTAWAAYGYDLDGKSSDAASTDHCKPAEGATTKLVYPDGDQGRDNGFGKNLQPLLAAFDPDHFSSAGATQEIEKGGSTLLFAIDKLGAAPTYNPLAARAYRGAKVESAPFDGTDVRPVLSSSLATASDLSSAKIKFDSVYVVGNVWVGKTSVLELGLGSFDFRVHDAVVSMTLSADRKSATNGTIAGVLLQSDLETMLKARLPYVSKDLCGGGPTTESILQQVRQCSDSLENGQQDPTKLCDAISLGLGFEASVVKLGDTVTPPAEADPCKAEP